MTGRTTGKACGPKRNNGALTIFFPAFSAFCKAGASNRKTQLIQRSLPLLLCVPPQPLLCIRAPEIVQALQVFEHILKVRAILRDRASS